MTIFSEVLPSGFPDVPRSMPLLANPSLLSASRLNFSRAKSCPSSMRREEARAQRTQEGLAPVIEQAIMRKEKVAPLAEDRFRAVSRSAASGERTAAHAGQEAARRRMLAAAQVPLENQLRNRLRLAALFSTCCAVASICQRLDVDWNYQLAGSLLRPRKTNVCRQSG